MKTLLTLAMLTLCILSCTAQPKQPERVVGTRCEDCEMMYEGMPEKINWDTRLTNPNEPGETMIISGTIYKPDGKTPAPGIILYVYHTDSKGLYSPSENQKDAIRHGHIRGWMKTNSKGQYQFRTIRPASYPNRKAPQHIHPIIKEPNTSRYWIDEYLFDDDPLLSQLEKDRQEKRGGPGIIHLTKNSEGIWIGKRDIILGMNVPNY